MKRIIWLLVAVIVVVVLWSCAWLYLSGQVRTNIEVLAEADGITTPRLTCTTLDISGFPFRLDAACGAAQIIAGDLVVDIAGIRASALVYRPTHVLASALGPVGLVDAFTGSRSTIQFSGLEASGRLDGWRLARLSLSARDLDWTDTLLGEQLIAKASLLDLQLGDIPEQYDAATGLAALAGYVQARDVVAPGFTITTGNAEIEVEVSRLPDDVRLLGDPAALLNWRAAGGQLKLVSAHGTDADSDLKASGSLELDAQGLLDGQIDIASTKVAERIEPFLLEPYRTLVLGNPAPDGTHANTLNFRSGTISSGLLPIASVPPLF
ncbi:DUF2125 domain-containing protein [uncultured Devosia sp.]|uniref:DUF2125 domain-containing protein n=1 Tax=uncultured Devosia sp. TaxID=211434 RepID=UPI0035CABBCC